MANPVDADLLVFGRRGEAQKLALVVARSLPGAEVKGRGDAYEVRHTRTPSLLRIKPDLVVRIDRRPFKGSGAGKARGQVRDAIVKRMRGPGLDEVLRIIDEVSVAVSFVPADGRTLHPSDRLFSVALDVAARSDGFCLDLANGRLLSITGQVVGSTEQLLAEGGTPIDPSTPRVRARLVALVAVAVRALTEYDGRDVEEARSGIASWVRALSIGAEMEPQEEAVLTAEPGTVGDEQLIDGTWQIEGAAVLAWALGLLDAIPPFDEATDPTVLSAALHFPDGARTAQVLRSATRRNQGVVDDEAARHYALHWRLQRYLDDGSALDLESFSRSKQSGPLQFDDVALLGGDLAVRDRPIWEADRDTLEIAARATAERFRALCWLRRGGPWSAVELEP